MRAVGRFFTHGLTVLGFAAAPACSSSSSPPPSSGPATFTSIYAMLFPTKTGARCNFCHGLPANNTSNGQLHMGEDAATAYAALVGKTSTSAKCKDRPLVVANQPDESLLLQKLMETPPCGSRMPLGGALLTNEQREMVRSWIAAGAKDD